MRPACEQFKVRTQVLLPAAVALFFHPVRLNGYPMKVASKKREPCSTQVRLL